MRCLLLALVATGLFAANPELVKVKSVYLLPMSNGMDQYLANRLQDSSLYVVTTDPQAADAIFTDTLGPAFERKFTELYPVPQEEDEEEPEPKEPERLSSFRKGRGMIFLVERRTKQVVWSTYELPKNISSSSLDRAAQRITERLRKSLDPKTAQASR
ncbi:MAG: hypothetical protein JNL98_33515 [Bryobacterales bacterium]|nr:hypothetical protein [Bryobacterales bacterium]